MIKAIITGTTGMVGEGVLIECLSNASIAEVLIINRRPSGYTHPKLKEIIHQDFQDITPIASELVGYNACYFCAGISSVGMNEADFTHITYTLTMHVAGILAKNNPDMTFCYISGAGTNAVGSQMWQKVKGRTENELIALSFKQVFAFRPGIMKPTKGQKNVLSYYKYFGWLYGPIKFLAPNVACTLAQLGQAMIAITNKNIGSRALEVKEIVVLASN